MIKMPASPTDKEASWERHAPFTHDEHEVLHPAIAVVSRVFNRHVTAEQVRTPEGKPMLLFSGWLLLSAPARDHFEVATVSSVSRRLGGFPCLSKGTSVGRQTMEAALVELVKLEAHRLVHEDDGLYLPPLPREAG